MSQSPRVRPESQCCSQKHGLFPRPLGPGLGDSDPKGKERWHRSQQGWVDGQQGVKMRKQGGAAGLGRQGTPYLPSCFQRRGQWSRF